MSVVYSQSGGGLLGTLGMLASLGGKFIPGAEWLTPLGLGVNAVNSVTKGNSGGALASLITGMKDSGFFNNTAQGANIAQSALTDDELMRKWQPFLNGGQFNTWQR